MSTFQTVIEAVQALLVGIDGTGSYTHDLSGTGKVVIGNPMATPAPPYVQIPTIGWQSSFDGSPLTKYSRTLLVPIHGFVASSDGTDEQRAWDCIDLLNDITLALESDPTLGGTVISMIVQAGVAGLEIEQEAELAGVYAEAVITLHKTTGV